MTDIVLLASGMTSYNGAVPDGCFYCESNGQIVFDDEFDIHMLLSHPGEQWVHLQCSFCKQASPFSDIPEKAIIHWNNQQAVLKDAVG